MLIIRKFKPDDMFAVIKIASDSLTEQYNPSLFNYFYETQPNGFIIAEKYHKIIGFIVGGKINQDTVKILMLAVAKINRMHGIGAQLLKNFLEEMITSEIRTIELEVRKNNENAVNFYKKNGFKTVEILHHFYQNGEDGLLMHRCI